MGPTITDIADFTGCSPGTVSSILSGSNTSIRYSAATRRKVLKAAGMLNYRPKAAHGVGVVYSAGPANPAKIDWVSSLSPMLTSIHSQALAEDKLLSVFCYSSAGLGSDLAGGRLPQIFRRRKIDGLIISGRLDESVIAHLWESRLPYVLMNVTDADDYGEDSICFDELFTGRRATRYLLDQGHRRILHVSVKWSIEHYSARLRREGYEQAMREAGLAPETIYLVEEEYDQLATTLAAILRRDDRPTAFFVYFEPIALFCRRFFHELGLGVLDVSLVTAA